MTGLLTPKTPRMFNIYQTLNSIQNMEAKKVKIIVVLQKDHDDDELHNFVARSEKQIRIERDTDQVDEVIFKHCNVEQFEWLLASHGKLS